MKLNKKACKYESDVPAYVNGELTPLQRRQVEAHMDECAACRQTVQATRKTLATLRTLTPVEPAGALTPEILAHLCLAQPHPCAWRISRWPRIAAAAAAAAVLFVGIWTVCIRLQDRFDSVLRVAGVPETQSEYLLSDSVRWLCLAQSPDGSWSAERWGGNPRFQIALSALAMLALIDADPTGTQALEAVSRGVVYMLAQQSPEGDFGAVSGVDVYNHGLATLALLRVRSVLTEQQHLDHALDRAITRIRQRQTPEGGWGYYEAGNSAATLSVTVWHMEALRQAVLQGWTAANTDLQRALQWVAGIVDDHGLFGYRHTSDIPEGANALTEMGASILFATDGLQLPPERLAQIRKQVLTAANSSTADGDYYRNYFLAAAIKAMPECGKYPVLASVREHVASRRETGHEERGSWPADDRWSHAGGRVYATAMAMMTVK